MQLRKTSLDLLLIALTLVTVFAIFTGTGMARMFMSVILVFVLPGASILSAWFSARLAKTPDNILLTIALSLAITAIGGLVLNLLPWGLQPQTWALWLGGVAVFNATAALIRDARRSVTYTPGNGWGFRLPQLVPVVLAGVLVVSAIALARMGAIEQPRPGFTQMWMIQTDGTNSIQLGVQNEESKPMRYRVVVRQGGLRVQSYDDIHIVVGERWETQFQFAANSTEPLEADLYQADAGQNVYRSVRLSLAESQP